MFASKLDQACVQTLRRKYFLTTMKNGFVWNVYMMFLLRSTKYGYDDLKVVLLMVTKQFVETILLSREMWWTTGNLLCVNKWWNRTMLCLIITIC